MKKLIKKLFFLILLGPAFQSFSQPLTKSEFRQLFTQGNLMMLDNFYDTAVKTFLKLHTSDPSNANVNYKIGSCYLHLPSEKRKAISYLENAIKQTSGNYQEDEPTEKNAPEDAIYYLGQAYHYAYRFDDAMGQFKKFRDIVGKWNLNLVKEIDHWSEMSKNAKELMANPVECTITNLGDSVNCEFADYSPAISADEEILVFTSRREGTGGLDNKTINDDFFEDIWLCRRGQYGTWTKAKSISRTINTDANEASIGLSADGQELYVYRDDKGDGNIYISKLDGDYWDAPYKMDINHVNSTSWEPSACISADGNTLYFVSDRPGGLGGRDIYQCRRLSNRTWSESENLGPTINTPYDEDAPFIHPDGVTFFFSSKGHNSMGGFDVFHTTKIANNVWTQPINIGYPINTTDDDIYFVTSSDGRRAYYASFRPEGKGEKDIYMVSMPKPFVRSVAILVGYLKNKDGSPIPQYSSVAVKSPNGEIVTSKPNEVSGKFIISQLPGREYEITIEANAQKVFMDKFFLPEDSSYQNLSRSFFQRTIYIGDTTRLFSMNKTSDTTSKVKVTPMDGKILFSQSLNDIADSVTIQLLNSQGNIIASTITNSKGEFKFQNIPLDQKYLIKIDENDPALKSHTQFYLANNDNKILMSSAQEGRFYLFKNLSPDLNRLSTLDIKDSFIPTTTMQGKLATSEDGKNGAAKMNIHLVDENGKIIQSQITDKSGNFTFKNIAGDKNYILSLKDNDPTLYNNQRIYLMNKQNALIKKVAKIADYFVFENIPADLNKLSALNIADTTLLITMKGKLVKNSNTNDGIENLVVNLVSSNSKIIQQTKTDASGAFSFGKLLLENNYTIKFNENDPVIASLNKIYLSNEADKVIKVIDLKKKENSFKNLPPNLMQLAELKENYISSANKDSIASIIHKKIIYPGDEKFDFVVYFPYNKKEINITVGSFVALMDKVTKIINNNGNATIMIAASSSTVPTQSYPSNESLAETRANEIKDKVRASMSLKNIDDSKISYEISSKVQGPEYKSDAMENRKEYEKWQFVKVIVK